MKKPENTVTKEDVFRYKLYYFIKDMYQEKVANKIANSVFNEVIINREGKVNSDDFRKIVEEIVPYSNKKEDVIERLAEQFGIYSGGAFPNESSLSEDIESEIKERKEEENEVQSMELKSESECKFCKRLISGRAMAKHLLSCQERKKRLNNEDAKEKVFLIKASAEPFFLYFDVNASLTLKEIDNFLRDIWLECCGHLSAFNIDNIAYAYDPQPEYNDRSLKVQLKNVLRPNLAFSYEYDFGTTTQLSLKVIAERRRQGRRY